MEVHSTGKAVLSILFAVLHLKSDTSSTDQKMSIEIGQVKATLNAATMLHCTCASGREVGFVSS